ncbi:MAG TPA: YsnF/AvaK domain-containing protein [Caulobacteraceae bacterium]|jgi:uncharacterized protein (TIGR02271 family)|nr:YsnF/AvaK domain-containing protein [Caulobacteraceae bacterium]
MLPEEGKQGDPGSEYPEATGAPSGETAQDPDTLRLYEEELSVDRVREETGRVRVKVVTREHEEMVEVPLTREYVEVERVPVGREVEAIPPRRQEGDTVIVPVVEEVVVVRRKLVLKEEIRLKLVRTTEQHRESVTLRRQEAVIERQGN